MYGHNNHSLIGYPSTDFVDHFPLLDMTVPPPLVIPAGEEYYFDSEVAAALPLKPEIGYSSSGCSSYGSPGYSTPRPSLIQRSVSSHSLQKKNNNNGFRQLVPTAAELLESETSPVRRVFSTGDLQMINMVQHYHRSESPLSNEISIIEGMSKAFPYSPEEKKERIERYRSKRNQRNFNKKIKYECRKTLADSRPRIRGRFARNDEIEKSSQNQWSHMGMEEEDEVDCNWINFLTSISTNLIP